MFDSKNMKQFFILILLFLFINAVQLEPTKETQILNTNLKQKWGYTEVYHDVFLFWWFYMENPPTKPLLIWLGFYSTAEANFNQYGPITSDLKWRNNSLIYDYNILYIDSIAGAGFSYVKENKLFTKTTHETSYDLFICIKSFFIKFPDFRASPIYIVADSFFGKIAPELAQLWNAIGPQENLESNLKGLIIGNDPYFSLQAKIWQRYDTIKENAMNWDQQLNEIVNEIELLKNQESWLKASKRIDYILNSFFLNISYGPESLINLTTEFFEKVIAAINNNTLGELMNYRVKKELNLKSTWTLDKSTEFINKVKSQTVKPKFATLYEELLKTTNLSITLLNTPMDLKIHPTMLNTLEWIDHLDWDGKDAWSVQHIKQFTFSDKIEGFKKSYENLHQYSITKNPNSDLETNAEFLRTVFAEVMK